jgi:hypothetical protein
VTTLKPVITRVLTMAADPAEDREDPDEDRGAVRDENPRREARTIA